jgi:hypothetical protein
MSVPKQWIITSARLDRDPTALTGAEWKEQKRFLWGLLAVLFLSPLLSRFSLSAANAQEITTNGMRLAALLDNMNVEQLWLAHQKVYWQTGLPKSEPVMDGKPHSHCSAFVAATAKKLHIYILRPPEHSSVMLANAQAYWLATEGRENGWKAVRTAEKAQRLANRGILVVAVYRARDEGRSGHIAIVRPSVKDPEQIRAQGPQIIQAGIENYTSTSLEQGFKHHRQAWQKRRIRFFSHEIDWGDM